MSRLTTEAFETPPPTPDEARLARELGQRLTVPSLHAPVTISIQVAGQTPTEPIVVPAPVLDLLQRVLSEMGQGHGMALVSLPAELTMQQAADLLGVSCSYLARLLDEGRIPCCASGHSRRVRYDDLMAYKRRDDAARARLADQLAAEAQELGLGY